MRRSRVALLIAALALLLGALALPATPAAAQEDEPPLILVMDINGAIDTVTERYLERVLKQAESRGAEAVVVRINTPGGLISSMRDLAEQLLNAPVPTIAYVWPSGAQAASAGTIVTIAAHVAAMAPATNIGAAAPVSGTGEDLPSTLRQKIDEDITALIRSIAAARGRNYAAIELTVLRAKAYSANEALTLNVIDHIAVDLDSLFNALDGLVIEMPDGPRQLRTAGAQIDELGRSLLEQLLNFLTNPNVISILLLVGAFGVILEIRDPGNFGPGVVGVLGLTLGFVGIGLTSVTVTGVVLIVAGILLLLLESQLDGFGWAGVGAVICWLIGGFLLFGDAGGLNDPARVSYWTLGVSGGLILAFIALVWVMGRGGGSSEAFIPEHERRLLGQTGAVVDILNPSGYITIGDERLVAMTDGRDIPFGEPVVVIGVYAGGIAKVVRADEVPVAASESEWRERADRWSLARLLRRPRKDA